jgi:hypothetical protein
VGVHTQLGPGERSSTPTGRGGEKVRGKYERPSSKRWWLTKVAARRGGGSPRRVPTDKELPGDPEEGYRGGIDGNSFFFKKGIPTIGTSPEYLVNFNKGVSQLSGHLQSTSCGNRTPDQQPSNGLLFPLGQGDKVGG